MPRCRTSVSWRGTVGHYRANSGRQGHTNGTEYVPRSSANEVPGVEALCGPNSSPRTQVTPQHWELTVAGVIMFLTHQPAPDGPANYRLVKMQDMKMQHTGSSHVAVINSRHKSSQTLAVHEWVDFTSLYIGHDLTSRLVCTCKHGTDGVYHNTEMLVLTNYTDLFWRK